MTFTCSPHLVDDRGLRALDAFLHLVQDAGGLVIRNRDRLIFGARKPVTFGVFLMSTKAASVISMFTST